jgi:hypothetical protein
MEATLFHARFVTGCANLRYNVWSPSYLRAAADTIAQNRRIDELKHLSGVISLSTIGRNAW